MSRADVAAVARLIARDGLVEGFGHVSARAGEGFLLTPTVPPLQWVAEDDVLTLDADGAPQEGDRDRCPLEAPLHAAIYAARPDVGAICRTHSPHAAAWAARGAVPPLVHGLGLLAGAIAVHAGTDLVAGAGAGTAAAAALGGADCLLLRANGAAATGPTLAAAAVRAHHLEERARIAGLAPGAHDLEGEELAARARHLGAELGRAWRWLAARHGDDDLHDLDPHPGSPDSARVSAHVTPNERRDTA